MYKEVQLQCLSSSHESRPIDLQSAVLAALGALGAEDMSLRVRCGGDRGAGLRRGRSLCRAG